MNAENFLVNNRSYRHAVEAIGEGLPELDPIFISAFALIIEAVNPVDGRTLVISSQQEEVFRVFNFVSQQKANGLQALLPAIHIITKEEVVGIGRETTIFEKPQKIIVLAMYVSHNLNGRLKLQQHGLRDEDIPRF